MSDTIIFSVYFELGTRKVKNDSWMPLIFNASEAVLFCFIIYIVLL